MKTAEDQLSTYKSVHLNKKNVMTHFVGVPLIIWSLLALLSLIEFPIVIPAIEIKINLAMLFFGFVISYYFLMHKILAFGAVLFLSPILLAAILVAQYDNAIWISVLIFVVGWAIQFLGHHFEKAKPAFVDDLNQLLIGPFFLLAELFFMFGLLKPLEHRITPMAVEKRRVFERTKQE